MCRFLIFAFLFTLWHMLICTLIYLFIYLSTHLGKAEIISYMTLSNVCGALTFLSDNISILFDIKLFDNK